MTTVTTSASCGVGFVCDIRGAASHRIVALGIEAVTNLTHRGAVGADGRTGDGAGVSFRLPAKFFAKELRKIGRAFPSGDALAVGVFFLSAGVERKIEDVVIRNGLVPLAWRDVPVNDDALGAAALAVKPQIRQLLIDASGVEPAYHEVRLFLARREIEKTCVGVYVLSLSSKIIVYKGMLVAPHLAGFYPDLLDKDIESPFCVFHQRFSTNTLPEWALAQPFRVLAHNGEINTLQGNRNWMGVLEHELVHPVFGNHADLIHPLVSTEESDSASLDRVVELLMLTGYPPEHAVMLCIPPAWEHEDLAPDERAFFEYHSLLMKPWDGPAAVAFTDGTIVGAHMDRNGLRPLRYTLTMDGLLVLGSETGMVDLGDRAIREKGRLGPGETISVDTQKGTVRFTGEILRDFAVQKPYQSWMRRLYKKAPGGTVSLPQKDNDIVSKQIAFGYTAEEVRIVIREMAASGKEFIYSMGDDAPLPPLAERPPLLFRYFKQRFSQVTNPAIDPFRERMVMSLTLNMGVKGNFLLPGEEHARRFGLNSPVLTQNQLRAIESQTDWPVKKIAMSYSKKEHRLEEAVRKLQKTVVDTVRNGNAIIVLSDADISEDRPAVPSLLALSASYKALLRARLASRASIIVETGETRDAHHIACLVGYGASAVCPWLAFQTVGELCIKGIVPGSHEQAALRYKSAVEEGLLKIIARVGITTANSYHAAQLFDAVCLNREFVDEYFTGTTVTLESAGMDEIEASLMRRHERAYGTTNPTLDFGGEMKYRKDGEFHAWAAPSVAALNRFMKSGEYAVYEEFARTTAERPVFIRHLLGYRTGTPVLIEQVETEEAILQRFVAGAMSVGALSPEAHETIAEACNRLGIKSNSGEGGEDPARYFGPKNSAIKQVASGRFGVTPAFLASAADLEIKIAQGAKPGEGGHLPKEKVTAYIARLRHCDPGMLLISPPPHHDVYSIEDLAQLIHDLKQANPRAHICVKLVAESGCGTVAAGVAKAYGDIVQISGCEGGTGAATIGSIKNAGSYWEMGIAEAQRALMENGLRGRVHLRVDGGIRTGRDVVIAALLGAEEFGFGTATMIAAGCVMARQCHSNTCPTGIATQDENLRKRFRGTVESITAYFRAVAREVREILAGMGVRSLAEIIGRNDLLVPLTNRKTEYGRVKLDPLLAPYPEGAPRTCSCKRNDDPAPSLNDRIVADALPQVEKAESTAREYEIRNIHRSIPVRLNYHIARLHGDAGLPGDTIRLTFRGTAGQSFGAFNHRGLSLTLIGDANDYAGKGMFGGRIAVIHADIGEPHKHVIVGNTVLYGAIGGEFYAAGMAGERFAVRNSGAVAVVEGAGRHLCEYMTRGTVVVLGEVGRNAGAGMTGGTIYVLDRDDVLAGRINTASVLIAALDDDDTEKLRSLIRNHYHYTGSRLAEELLSAFDTAPEQFRKVIPR